MKFFNIDKQALFETTFNQLKQDTITGFPDTRARQHLIGTVKINNVDVIPYAGMKAVLFNSTTKSDFQIYKTMIMFTQVGFIDTNPDDNEYADDNDTTDQQQQSISLRKHDVKVRCSCLDFYFRFAWYNHLDKSIYGGKPKPYQRKTANYPSVNPTKTRGMCKHIMALGDHLQRTGQVEL